MKTIRFLLGLAMTATIALGVSLPAYADVNDFEITNYDMKLELGRDTEHRSTLQTTEIITADFKHHNRNRGIERAIPKTYDGHKVDLRVVSITDEQGKDLEYTTYNSNGNEVVRIGNKDTYVQGLKTYKLTYIQRDVTRHFADTAKDEWYWNLNGTQWRVPIREFNAEIRLVPEVLAAYAQSACYQGRYGVNNQCELAKDGDIFRVKAQKLTAGENITVAFGFAPETFAGYQPSLVERLLPWWLGAQVVTGIVSVVAVIWASVRYAKRRNRTSELGTIVPEYLPPKNASVTTSAEVLDTPRAVVAAQLIDFAVRHYIKIIETKPKKGFWSTAEYTLEIVKDISSLRDEEQEILRDLFDNKTTVGTRLEMKKLQNSTALYKRMQDNPEKLKKLVRSEYGLRVKNAVETQWFTRMAKVLAVIGVLTVAPFVLVMAGVIWLIGWLLWTLTDKGLTLRRYLKGLKLYIGVAEQERLKLLQSPEGAEKVGDGTADSPEKIVKLYEKVLPYAVLFGQEKEWSKQLGSYYESTGSNPDWYTGTNMTAFNAGMLAGAISNFNTSTSYTASSGSSSGGSSGGGFSGGGGGGGGGGGW